jgi:hypothetical protein
MKKSIVSLVLTVFALTCVFAFSARADVLPATIPIIPADGSFVSVTGPVYQETASGDVGVGTIILNAPEGYQFDTNSPVTVLIQRTAGTGGPGNNINDAPNGQPTAYPAVVTSTQITFTITSSSTNNVLNSLTWQGIRLAIAVGVPDAESHITKTGTSVMTGVVEGVTSFGQVTSEPRPVQLSIQMQPSAMALVGVPFAQQPVVQVLDQSGNLWSNSITVTASLASGSGTLQGTTTVTSVDGIATFTNLSHNVAGTITIAFSSTGLVSAVSTDVVVSSGAADRLIFSTQPGSAVYNTVFGTQPVVQTADEFGNPSVIGLPTNLVVTVALYSGTGTLLGTTTADIGTAAGNGTVTFNDLRIDATGEKQLIATAPGFTNAISDTFTVAQASQTITFAPLPNRNVGDVFTVSAVASSGLPVTFTIVTGPATISGNTITVTNAGEVTVRASQAGDENFLAALDVDQTFTVLPAKLDQTITFGAITNRVLGDAPFTLTATASSGLPVSFSIVSGPATIEGDVITLTGAGYVTVRASQSGDTNYNAAPSVDQTFLVRTGVFLAGDFDENGSPDILVMNTNRTLTLLLMDKTNLVSLVNLRDLAPVADGWDVVAQNDLDGDGMNDILFQHTDGRLAVWFLHHTTFLNAQGLKNDLPVQPGWRAIAMGDLDANGNADIIFQHNDNRLAVWLMNGLTIQSGKLLKDGTPIGAGWRAVAARDLGLNLTSGKADILFQHTDGRLAIWLMNGTSVVNSTVRSGPAASTGWKVVGFADFSGDASPDLLWHNSSGGMAIWRLFGANFQGVNGLNGVVLQPGAVVLGPK